MKRIEKVLIANRGEIACRIMRAARARGARAIAVYSDADAGALHVRMADEALRIGGAEARDSYLNGAAIIDAAKRSGADAIHPGYGFLSERSDFARAVIDAGLIFIGPPPDAIAAMGDKAASKRRMIEAGVPTIPGYQGDDQSDARLAREASEIGFPVMLKASAGGGGRGQRVVTHADEFAEALASARREAKGAFGDDRMIIERAIVGARHVEAQVMADAHGAVLFLGDRDCSLQRRRQKVIEEAPSPAMDAELRAQLGLAAVAAARAVKYRNAGTVEFLLDPAKHEFYFLEMNTRLQVEHPVTECVTGVDLVALQFDIAEGAPIPFSQEDVRLHGAAIEARLYAEDAAAGFLPQTGRIALFEAPSSARVDSGVQSGDAISSYYDPMIAKIIVSAPTREEARRGLIAALRNTHALGVTTNRDFLIALLEDDAFAAGAADIGHIDRDQARLSARAASGGKAEAALLGAVLRADHGDLLTGFSSRAGAETPVALIGPDGSPKTIRVRYNGANVAADGHAIVIVSKSADSVVFRDEGVIRRARYVRDGDAIHLDCEGVAARFVDTSYAPADRTAAGGDDVRAPMNGAVAAVLVQPGDAVKRGDTLAIVEAMKMEHALKAPRDGVVARIAAKAGDQARLRDIIVALEPAK
jgi:geranyl-CoA carboxylase alpha subunit